MWADCCALQVTSQPGASLHVRLVNLDAPVAMVIVASPALPCPAPTRKSYGDSRQSGSISCPVFVRSCQYLDVPRCMIAIPIYGERVWYHEYINRLLADGLIRLTPVSSQVSERLLAISLQSSSFATS